MGSDLSGVPLVLLIEEQHQGGLPAPVGAKYEEYLADFEVKSVDSSMMSGKT